MATVFLGVVFCVGVGVGFGLCFVGEGIIVGVGAIVGSIVGAKVGVGVVVSVGVAVGVNVGTEVGVGVCACVGATVLIPSVSFGSIVCDGAVVSITVPSVLVSALLFLLLKLANKNITAANKQNKNNPNILFLFFTS